jgi:hypothetical protein
MPWDDEDGGDWKKEKHLEPRIMLFYDLKNKNMSKKMSSHIRCLIHEAKYIQKQRENLELLIDNEDSDQEEDMQQDQSENVKKLMKLHFRLHKIKAEFEFLVNPVVRKTFDMPGPKTSKIQEKQFFAIAAPGALKNQLEFLGKLEDKIPPTTDLQISGNFQDALANCQENDEIYLSTGQHSINFLEYLNGNLLISGFRPYHYSKADFPEVLVKNYSVVGSQNNDGFLLAIDGNLTLENLVIDCENVGTGILVKDGNVLVKNCLIYCHSRVNMIEGISLLGGAKMTIENSVIQNFNLGISVGNGAKLMVKHSVIQGCNTAVQSNGKCQVFLENSDILDSEDYAVSKLIRNVDSDEKVLVVKDLKEQLEK